LGFCNGTTGEIVAIIYDYSANHRVILKKVDVTIRQDAQCEPQIPVVLMRVDEEFWNKRKTTNKFIVKPVPRELLNSLPKNFDNSRVVCIDEVPSFNSPRVMFNNRILKNVRRIQLPIIPSSALTVHKAQGLTKDNIVVYPSTYTFARGLSYVALSRCTSLNGIQILGREFEDSDFSSRPTEVQKIFKEIERLRELQKDTMTSGLAAYNAELKEKSLRQVELCYSATEPEFCSSRKN